MSFNGNNQAIYRDAFRKTDEVAAIIEIAPPGRLVDATDRLLTACHLNRATALGRPLDRLFSADTAARLIEVARAAVANDRGETASHGAIQAPSTRFLGGRISAVPLSATLAYLKAIEGFPAGGSRRDVLLNEMSALSDGLIYIYDVARQRTSYMNSNLARLLGAEPGSTMHLSRVAPLVHAKDLPNLVRRVKGLSTLMDRQVSRHSFRLFRRSDNSWRVIENRYAALARDAKGGVRSIIGCAFDATDRDISLERGSNADALFRIEEGERRRIARELHDSTAQHLVAADLMVGAHLRQNGNTPDEALASARATLGQALREIRTLSFLLHPPGTQTSGVAKMLRGFAAGFAERSNLLLAIEMDSVVEKLPPGVELILFRVCQEAFMNVRRHANASSVTLRLYMRGDNVFLEVEDDGNGIDDSNRTNPGVGIESMRERLEEVGGVLTIESSGHGTLVRACAPLEYGDREFSTNNALIANHVS